MIQPVPGRTIDGTQSQGSAIGQSGTDRATLGWMIQSRWDWICNTLSASIGEGPGWDKWDFLEIANEVELADLRNIFVKFLEHPPTTKLSSLIWAKREDYIAAHGEITEELELPARKVESDRWGKNP